MDSIERAIYPLSLTAFVFGFGIFRHSLHNPKSYISICYSLIVWSVYIYGYYYTVNLFSLNCVLPGYLHWFIMIITLLVTTISIINTICNHKQFARCIRKLSLVSDTLEELGIFKEYHEIRTSANWMLIIWFTVLCIGIFADCLCYINNFKDTRAIFIAFIFDYLLCITTFIDIMFVLFLRYIGTRFDKINYHIGQLSKTEEYGNTWKKSFVINRLYNKGVKPRQYILWITMHLHSDLCRTARDINNLFQIQMTLQMMSYSIIIISVIYFQYYYYILQTLKPQSHNNEIHLNTDQYNFLFSTVVWLTFYLIRLILLNHICDSVSAKYTTIKFNYFLMISISLTSFQSQETKTVIHKLTNLVRFTKTHEEIIMQFLLQISIRPLQFTGMGLFSFGYNFLRQFCFWMVTAVVFLIQMNTHPLSQLSYSNENNITCYRN